MARITLRSRRAPTHSKREAQQKRWLIEKFPLFLNHQAKKTLGQFFSPLYEEYFAKWPLVPTEQDISEGGDDTAVTLAKVQKIEEERIYKWMHNRTRSKHGVKGQGSSASKNLTTGPPKKKAALQAYVKYYWESKIKQAVIDQWAPTPETDLFGETENGEEQVAWEAMNPMEKNIPLWFRMRVARKLYDAESDEIKAEVDRRREEEKEAAIAAAPTAIFTSDEERLEVMNRFDRNFSKLSSSLTNLCANILRDFGFHTSIIVGGPIIRDGGRISSLTYESPGSEHKNLTFSQFCGDSYETDIEGRFIEYLRHCFPKEVRRLYTLDSVPDIGSANPPSLFDATPAAQITSVSPTSLIASAPDLGVGSSLAIADNPQVHTPPTNFPQDNIPQVNPPNVPQLDAGHTGPNVLTVGLDVTSSPTAEATEGEVLSDGSTLPEIFDVGMEDSAPLAASPPVIAGHPTVEIAEQPPPPDPATVLIDTPPELLSADEDIRPQWLMTAMGFLRCVLYFGNLGRAVDLWLAQEARLGYPQRSGRLALPASNRPMEIAEFMKWARNYSRGNRVDARTFGTAVLEWWLTIQPTSRKAWPPVYDNLPDDFSFDYFNRGGPNGVFLMILCLCWWSNALDENTDCTDFVLVVNDVCWVFEQIASKA